MGKNWTMEKQAITYAKAVAFATKVWFGNQEAANLLDERPSLDSIWSLCDPFDGGNPSTELFFARRTQTSASSGSSRKLGGPGLPDTGEKLEISCQQGQSRASTQKDVPQASHAGRAGIKPDDKDSMWRRQLNH